MNDISSLNTESIVFVVEQEDVRRMLGMLLASISLDARIYPNCDEYLTRHNSSQTQYLVLDMPFPGMDGLIIRQQDTDSTGKNQAIFQGTPVKNQQPCESFLFRKQTSNAVIMDSADGAFLNARELRL
jgi:CheY-like chemotaxis protein